MEKYLIRNVLGLSLWVLSLIVGVANASEVVSTVAIESKITQEDLISPRGIQRFTVTVGEYIESNYDITHGFVCYSDMDILCVNKICGDNEHYWAIILNGNEQNTSLNSVLSAGDVLELVYRKKSQADHRKLRDWLLSYGKER